VNVKKVAKILKTAKYIDSFETADFIWRCLEKKSFFNPHYYQLISVLKHISMMVTFNRFHFNFEHDWFASPSHEPTT